MKKLAIVGALIFSMYIQNVTAQKMNLVGSTWRISYCTCYGGDNDWIDGGLITFSKNGKTDSPDERWTLNGRVLKVTTNDTYGREFTGRFVKDRFTGTLFEGMNRRAMKFVAVKR